MYIIILFDIILDYKYFLKCMHTSNNDQQLSFYYLLYLFNYLYLFYNKCNEISAITFSFFYCLNFTLFITMFLLKEMKSSRIHSVYSNKNVKQGEHDVTETRNKCFCFYHNLG